MVSGLGLSSESLPSSSEEVKSGRNGAPVNMADLAPPVRRLQERLTWVQPKASRKAYWRRRKQLQRQQAAGPSMPRPISPGWPESASIASKVDTFRGAARTNMFASIVEKKGMTQGDVGGHAAQSRRRNCASTSVRSMARRSHMATGRCVSVHGHTVAGEAARVCNLVDGVRVRLLRGSLVHRDNIRLLHTLVLRGQHHRRVRRVRHRSAGKQKRIRKRKRKQRRKGKKKQ